VTVAAVILSSTAEGALAPTQGRVRVKLLVSLAAAGGAFPVIVVSPDDDREEVALALGASGAVYGLPAPHELGPAGQMVRGADLAIAESDDTTAVLIWPARMTWVRPDTIRALIAAHQAEPTTMLLPTWRADSGWPVLFSIAHLDALRAVAPDRMPPHVVADLAAVIPTRDVDLGDPGVVHDVDTPLEELGR
jgi:CTP:molybdopterin cytidylyltransferase MocA